jgi:hypothetical protein
MNRTAATTYLTEEYRELATNAKFTTQQTTDAYNIAIDMSLRYLSFEESALSTADVAQADVLKYYALLDYFALKRFLKLLSILFDVTLPGPLQALRSQAFKNVGILLERAESELANKGIVIGGNDSGYQLGRMTLDFLEPSHHFGGF